MMRDTPESGSHVAMTTAPRYGHRSGHRNTRPACTSRNAYGAGVVLMIRADHYMWEVVFSAPDKRPGRSCRDRGSACRGFNPRTPIEVFADLELRRNDSASLRRTEQQNSYRITHCHNTSRATNHLHARARKRGNMFTNPIMRYFEYSHLPVDLQPVSLAVCELAQRMDQLLIDGPEKSAGLRKLLEAKDCLVRAAITG